MEANDVFHAIGVEAKIGATTKIWHREKSIILACVIGEECTIHAPVWIGNNVVIGDRCKIQAFAFIPDGVTIDDDVFIGPHVCFTNDKYPPQGHYLPTRVHRGVSIGANATILCGLEIGEYAKIAAGAVVTKNVPSHRLAVGNPARITS